MNIDNILPQLFQRLDETFWPNEAIWTTPLIKVALLTSALRSIGIPSHLVQCQLHYGKNNEPSIVHRGTLYALRIQDQLLNLRDHKPISWEDLARSYVFTSSHWVRHPAVIPYVPPNAWRRFKSRLRAIFPRRETTGKFWEIGEECISPDYDIDPAVAPGIPVLVSFSNIDIARAHAIASSLVLEKDTITNTQVGGRARL